MLVCPSFLAGTPGTVPFSVSNPGPNPSPSPNPNPNPNPNSNPNPNPNPSPNPSPNQVPFSVSLNGVDFIADATAQMQYKFYEQPDYHIGLDPTGGPRQVSVRVRVRVRVRGKVRVRVRVWVRVRVGNPNPNPNPRQGGTEMTLFGAGFHNFDVRPES